MPHPRATESTRRTRLTRSLAAAVASLGAVFAPLVAASPATAAGYGYGEWLGGFWHGSYAEGGTLVYCLDPDLPDPVGLGVAAVYGASGYGGLSPNQIAGLAALASTTGQTADPVLAHVVNDAIWIVTSGYTPSDPSTAAQSVAIAAWVDTYTPAPSSGTAAMSLATAPDDASLGTLTVDAVSTGVASGTISLVNAVFEDTGLVTQSGALSAGQSFPIRGVPPGPGPYRVSATFQGTGSTGSWPAEMLINYYGPSYQPLVGVSAPTVVAVAGATEDADPRPNNFAPAVSTAVASGTIELGESLVDVVRPMVIENAAGNVVDWFAETATGPWAPITYRASIYRTAAPLQDGDPIPPDAVLVDDSIAFTTDPATDPTSTEVRVQGPTVTASGYYVWVWRADATDQTTAVAEALLDPEYAWADPTRRSETTLVPLAATGDASLGIVAVLGSSLAIGGGGLIGLAVLHRRPASPRSRRASFRGR